MDTINTEEKCATACLAFTPNNSPDPYDSLVGFNFAEKDLDETVPGYEGAPIHDKAKCFCLYDGMVIDGSLDPFSSCDATTGEDGGWWCYNYYAGAVATCPVRGGATSTFIRPGYNCYSRKIYASPNPYYRTCDLFEDFDRKAGRGYCQDGDGNQNYNFGYMKGAKVDNVSQIISISNAVLQYYYSSILYC